MSKKIIYVFSGVALATLFIILASQIVMAGPPSIPITIHGVATINGEVAPEGTTVEAFINGNCVDEDTVSASGEYTLVISGEAEDLGKATSIYVNGIKVPESKSLNSDDYSMDLAVEGSTEPKKKSSGSGSKASFVNSDRAISGSDGKIAESKEGTEAAPPEEHSENANVGGEASEGSENASSDEVPQDLQNTRTPGFNFAYALVGMIIICFMSGRKKLR
ncbi:MAG: hypothetical protein PHV51_09380 [Methanosarcinaceae archaeon]|nr:hypothetical protein [Methanosarcinaceae archaeon]MDD4498341.1 hypothetical protein [Methanosarcinaceae archaeon]